jgi:prolyl 4-hydroxylase
MKKRNLIILLVVLLIIALVASAAVLFNINCNTETFKHAPKPTLQANAKANTKETVYVPDSSDTRYPPDSYPALRNREPVDTKLRNLATEIRGTSDTPIYMIDNFMTDDECDSIIQGAQGKLVPSPLTRQDPNDENFRTSQTCYFDGSGIQNKIEKRIADLIEKPMWSSESSQIQHYKLKNQFKAHWDYFDPRYDKDFWTKGQRTWTCMVYLNDVERGGSTKFVKLNESSYPKKGRIVIWSNLKPDGTMDPMTMHQGSPVDQGEKYIITKWFIDKKYEGGSSGY